MICARLIIAVVAVFGHVTIAAAQSSSVFSASSAPISGSSDTATASADFRLSGTTLTVTVKNSGTTSSNASILDGIFFNSNTAAAVNQIPGVTATQSWNGSTVSSNVDYSGGWQMLSSVTPPGGSTYSYGLSAVGGNGTFASNAFTKGNGSDDYGLMGSATCPNGICATRANKSPLAVGSVVFSIANFLGTMITSVELVYNSGLSSPVATTMTSGSTSVKTTAVPEPGSTWMLASGLAALFVARRHRHVLRSGSYV